MGRNSSNSRSGTVPERQQALATRCADLRTGDLVPINMHMIRAVADIQAVFFAIAPDRKRSDQIGADDVAAGRKDEIAGPAGRLHERPLRLVDGRSGIVAIAVSTLSAGSLPTEQILICLNRFAMKIIRVNLADYLCESALTPQTTRTSMASSKARRYESRMCNLYSMTSNQEAMRRLFKFSGHPLNLPSLPGIFPGQDAPVVRQTGPDTRELVMMSWGFVLPQSGKAPNASPTRATTRSGTARSGANRSSSAAVWCRRPALPNRKAKNRRSGIGSA